MSSVKAKSIDFTRLRIQLPRPIEPSGAESGPHTNPRPPYVRWAFLKGPIPLDWLTRATALPGKAPIALGLAVWFESGRPPDWRGAGRGRARPRNRACPQWVWPPVCDPHIRQLLAARCRKRVAGIDPADAAARAACGLAADAPEGVRVEVQARLLARQTDAQIEQKTGVPATTVGLYEKLYFNFRDQLACPSFIANKFLNVTAERPTLADALRQVAYAGGPTPWTCAWTPFVASGATNRRRWRPRRRHRAR